MTDTPWLMFLDDDMEKPDGFVEPIHNPVDAAFVRPSTGFLPGDNRMYAEWLSYRGEFSWMNTEWKNVEDLYGYWPFLSDFNGKYAKETLGHTPHVICSVIEVSSESITPVGVALLDRAPSVKIADRISKIRPDLGISKFNIGFIPLEILACDGATVQSAFWWWHNTLTEFDWQYSDIRMDTMVYWAYVTRNMLNSQMTNDNAAKSMSHKKSRDLKHIIRRKKSLRDNSVNTYTRYNLDRDKTRTDRELLFYDYTLKDELILSGSRHSHMTYDDPMLNRQFVDDILPDVPAKYRSKISPNDIAEFYSNGTRLPGIEDFDAVHDELRAILETYPISVRQRLKSGLYRPLGSKKNIGELADARRRSNTGNRFISYEVLQQSRA